MQTILLLRLYKNKCKNIVHKNYNNSKINTDVNTICFKVLDQGTRFKGKHKVKKHEIIDYKIR